MADQQQPVLEQQPVVDEVEVAKGLGTVIDRTFAPPPEPEKATKALVAPLETAKQTYLASLDLFLHDWHLPWFIAWALAALLGSVVLAGGILGASFVWLLSTIGVDIAEASIEFIDEIRKGADVGIAEVGVVVLNEMLGTEFNVADMPTGGDVAGHIQRAERVGALFLQQLIGELGGHTKLEPEDGYRAASRFLGFSINFGAATGLLSLLGEFGTFGKIDAFRHVGVEVARNLGLGRLSRMFLRPLVTILGDTPITWQLNQQFHPTQFKPSEVINPFSGAVMDTETIFNTLELEGYSQDKIRKLIELHQKRLAVSDVAHLVRWAFWQRSHGIDYISKLGFPGELAETVLNVNELARADGRVTALIDTLETRVSDGHLTIEEFDAAIAVLPLSEPERELVKTTARYKGKTAHTHLSIAELQSAFEQGILATDDLHARFLARGFSEEDSQVLLALILLKVGKGEEAAKRKGAAAKARADRAAALAARKKKA